MTVSAEDLPILLPEHLRDAVHEHHSNIFDIKEEADKFIGGFERRLQKQHETLWKKIYEEYPSLEGVKLKYDDSLDSLGIIALKERDSSGARKAMTTLRDIFSKLRD